MIHGRIDHNTLQIVDLCLCRFGHGRSGVDDNFHLINGGDGKTTKFSVFADGILASCQVDAESPAQGKGQQAAGGGPLKKEPVMAVGWQ